LGGDEGDEGKREGKEREEGEGLFVLVPALSDAEEVDGVPDDGVLERGGECGVGGGEARRV